MDFVDLDLVLDEFEEEEKQALTMVPGQELTPSGYLEFLERHQEQDWALINPNKFSSTSGYTLERRSAREPVNVSYDDPYESFTYKFGVMASNHLDTSNHNGYERSFEGKTRRNKSAIVTSLTRISVNDDDEVNTVYSTTVKPPQRKGIANCSERKGTIAYKLTEVQTDALSPASEKALMESPFPKSDIIVDGHGDTTVSRESASYSVIDQGKVSVAEIEINTTEGGAEAQISLALKNTSSINDTPTEQTVSRTCNKSHTFLISSSPFNLYTSAFGPNAGHPILLEERVDAFHNSTRQLNIQSSVNNSCVINTRRPLEEQTVNIHKSCTDVLDNTGINKSLYELNDHMIMTNNPPENIIHSITSEPPDIETYVPNTQSNLKRQSESVFHCHYTAEPEVDNYSKLYSESLFKNLNHYVVSESSEGIIGQQGLDVVSGSGDFFQDELVRQQSEKLDYWNNVCQSQTSDGKVSIPHVETQCEHNSHVETQCEHNCHVETQCKNNSHIETQCEHNFSVEFNDENINHVEAIERNVIHVESSAKSISLVESREVGNFHVESGEQSNFHVELSKEGNYYVEPSKQSNSHVESGKQSNSHVKNSVEYEAHKSIINNNISHSEFDKSNIFPVKSYKNNCSTMAVKDNNVSHFRHGDKSMSNDGDSCISNVELNTENILHIQPNSKINSCLEPSEKIISLANCSNKPLEINTIPDDKDKIEKFTNNIGHNLFQGRIEIETILDEVILKQQHCLLDSGSSYDLLLQHSDILDSSNYQANTGHISNDSGGKLHQPLPSMDYSGPDQSHLHHTCAADQLNYTSAENNQVPSFGTGARPKDPSGNKKNRPNSLLGLSKVKFDLPTTVKPKVEADMVTPSPHGDKSVKSSVISDTPEKSHWFSNIKLTSSHLPDSHTVQEARLGQEPLDAVDGTSLASPEKFCLFSNTELTSSHVLDSHPVHEAQLRSVSSGKIDPQPTLHDFSKPVSQIKNSQESLITTNSALVSQVTDNNTPSKLDMHSLLSLNREHVREYTKSEEAQTQNTEKAKYLNQRPDQTDPTGILPAPTTQTSLGDVAPFWIPDSEALSCMICESRFTIWKRRHHCRACGKVLCTMCCSQKAVLRFMDNKEARVCIECHIQLNLVPPGMVTALYKPAPKNPIKYRSKHPPNKLVTNQDNRAIVLIPVGVLKSSGSHKQVFEPKQVKFSDGCRPGGDQMDPNMSEPTGLTQESTVDPLVVPHPSTSAQSVQVKGSSQSQVVKEDSLYRSQSLIPKDGVPPLSGLENTAGYLESVKTLNWLDYWRDYKSEEGPLAVYTVNKNLSVGVKIINLDCCMNRTCWCFVTRGMDTAGQGELVVLLEVTEEGLLSTSLSPPSNIFWHFQTIYKEALKGNIIQHMDHFVFTQRLTGNHEYGGLLFLQPTLQCLNKIPLPQSPYLFGVLIHQGELPWARVLPIRLMLRLGAEFRYYPCPILSMSNRKPVFYEIGHTIINLLADFRNYQYTLPQIKGVTIHMESKKTTISFPRNRYNDIMKAVRNSNEHVMALGSTFSLLADSHLVCIQGEDGSYQTQAINIQTKPRLVTGASFVVFNGALKQSSGPRAKSSIVEDGLMVQVLPEMLVSIKESLKSMSDYTIQCGTVEAAAGENVVVLRWVDNDKNFNIGVKSYIDGTSLEGVESMTVRSPSDYLGATLAIRWTRVYFLQNKDPSSCHFEPIDVGSLKEEIAHATCAALVKQLDELKKEDMVKLGLRVNLTRDSIGYEVGSNGLSLPVAMLNNLDTFLVPVIHQASEEGIVLEFIFNIID